MKPESDDASLDNAIRQATGRIDVQFDESAWKKRHTRDVAFIESLKLNVASVQTSGERQMMFKRPMVSAVVAASVALVAFVVIVWGGGESPTRVFANCLQQMRATSYEFDMDVVVTNLPKPSLANSLKLSLKGLVLEPGKLRLEQRQDKESISTVIDNKAKRTLSLVHRSRIAIRSEIQDDDKQGGMGFQMLAGRSIANLWDLEAGDEKKLGAKEMDGKKVSGFQVTKKYDKYTETITVWAEAKSSYPLQVDIVRQSAEPETSALSLSMKHFKILPSLDRKLFATEVPEGYTLANAKTLEQINAESRAGNEADTSDEGRKLLESVKLWSQGNKQKAVDLWMSIDWTADIRFAPAERLFTMAERQYNALVEGDRTKFGETITQQLSQYRGLARELLQLGQKARESQDNSKAEAYDLAVLGLGRTLSRNPDGLLIVRLVGIAYQAGALDRLSKLYQVTEQRKKLESVREQLKHVNEQRRQIQSVR